MPPVSGILGPSQAVDAGLSYVAVGRERVEVEIGDGDWEHPCQTTGYKDAVKVESRIKKLIQRTNRATKPTRQTTCCPGASSY